MKKKKIKKVQKEPNPVGSPPKYRPEFCDKLIEFFDQEPYEDVEIPHFDSDGKTIKWNDLKRLPNKLPTLVGFAKSIKVSIRTVYYWIEKGSNSFQEEFMHTFTCIAKRLQKDTIIQNGLQGLYNPAFAKFVSVNITDMRDKNVTEHEGLDNVGITLLAPKERKNGSSADSVSI